MEFGTVIFSFGKMNLICHKFNISNKMEKCTHCKKKSHVIVTCSCKKHYCLSCRLPETHNCMVDYVEKGKLKLMKENPVIVGEKLLKI